MAFKRIRVHIGKRKVIILTSTRAVSKGKTEKVSRAQIAERKSDLKEIIGHRAYCLAKAIFRNSFVEAIRYEKYRIVVYPDRFRMIEKRHEDRIVKMLIDQIFNGAKRIEVTYE